MLRLHYDPCAGSGHKANNNATSNGCNGQNENDEFGKLGPVGQVPDPKEVRDLFERRFASQLVDVVAAVDEFAFFPKHVAQCGRRGNHTLQALGFRQGGLVGNGCAAVGPGNSLLPLVKWRYGGSTKVSHCRSSAAARSGGQTRVALLR